MEEFPKLNVSDDDLREKSFGLTPIFKNDSDENHVALESIFNSNSQEMPVQSASLIDYGHHENPGESTLLFDCDPHKDVGDSTILFNEIDNNYGYHTNNKCDGLLSADYNFQNISMLPNEQLYDRSLTNSFIPESVYLEPIHIQLYGGKHSAC